FLGDVQMAENFQARNDRRVVLAHLRGNVGFLQYAVDSIAHAKLVFKGFHVYVGGPRFQSFGQHLVDELDDRSILGGDGEVQVVLVLFFKNFDVVGGAESHGLERVGAHA